MASTQDLSSMNRQGALYAATISCTILAVIAVVARLFARWHSAFKFGADDILIVLSLCTLLAFTVGHLVVIQVGYGRPTVLVTNMRVFIQATVSNITAYAIGTALTKISILCFYSRMFFSRGLNRLNWVFGAFIVLYSIALILVTALQCIPLSSTWTGKPGSCINTSPPFLALSVINFVTDIAIVCIPVRFVLRLHMDTFRKMQVLAVFMTGAVVCAFGIVRVVALAGLEPGDPAYNMAWPGVWSFSEQAIGIVGACLPSLGSYVTKKRVQSITSSITAVWSGSSRRKSPMGTSTLESAMNEGQEPAPKVEKTKTTWLTKTDSLSGETMNSTENTQEKSEASKNDPATTV